MQQNYPVIICGAGPTGLMLAAQLIRFNIDFLIIDKKSAPTTESRAVVVQARSMEIYEQMNLSDEIIANAEKSDGLCFWRHGKKINEVALKDFGTDITPFDFILMYEQNKNETLLNNYLIKNGREVAWNTEFISYKKDDEIFVVTLKNNEQEFEVKASYLAACDGGRSKVRDLTEMEFTGGTYENVFYVADTHVKADVCQTKLNFFVANDTFNLLFPMTGERRFRAIGILPKQFYHQKEISFGEVSEQVKKDAELDLGFYDTNWYSTYRLHHKKIKSFNKGNIFFCGDAAHVHSPAGGQGMNTGLQDAYNLAWKLALVIQQKAKPNLLETYHEERNPIAEDLLKTTDTMFRYMSNNSTFDKLLRMYLVPGILAAVMKIKAFRRMFFLLVSQTEISYMHSSIARGTVGKIKAGMRFPYIKLSIKKEKISAFHLIRANAAKPFLLMIYNADIKQLFYNEIYSQLQVEKNEFNDKVLHAAGFSSSFVCLIRPDNYIGYIAETFNENEFKQYLDSFLN